jgi:hypothetical protein
VIRHAPAHPPCALGRISRQRLLLVASNPTPSSQAQHCSSYRAPICRPTQASQLTLMLISDAPITRCRCPLCLARSFHYSSAPTNLCHGHISARDHHDHTTQLPIFIRKPHPPRLRTVEPRIQVQGDSDGCHSAGKASIPEPSEMQMGHGSATEPMQAQPPTFLLRGPHVPNADLTGRHPRPADRIVLGLAAK